MREFGFYYKELLLSLKELMPEVIIGSIFVIVMVIVIGITRKIVDRKWLSEPDKLEKATKIKIRIYVEEIKRLKRINTNLIHKNRALTITIKSANNILMNVKE